MALSNQIKVVIAASDKSKKAFQSAESNMGKLKAASASLVTTMAPLMATAAAAGIVAIGKESIEAADKIQKMALRLDASTEFLSQMQHVADLSGTSFDSVAKGVRYLQKNLSDAQDGLTTAKRAFAEINLEVDDLRRLSPDEQFKLIGDRIAAIEDPARRTQVAMNIFGRAGSELIPIFNQGAGALASMMAEADSLGLTLSQDAADGAADAVDAMGRLKNVSKGLARTISVELAPAVADLGEAMLGPAISTVEFTRAMIDHVKIGGKFVGVVNSMFEALVLLDNPVNWFKNRDQIVDAIGGIDRAVWAFNQSVADLIDGEHGYNINMLLGEIPERATTAGKAMLDLTDTVSSGLKDFSIAGTREEWEFYDGLLDIDEVINDMSDSAEGFEEIATDSFSEVDRAAQAVGYSITNSMTAAIMDTKRQLLDLHSIGRTILSGFVSLGLGSLANAIVPGSGAALGFLTLPGDSGGGSRPGDSYGPQLKAAAPVINIYSAGDIFSDPLAKRRVAEELHGELAKVAAQIGPS